MYLSGLSRNPLILFIKKLLKDSNDYNSFLLNKIKGFLDNPDKYIPVEKTKIPDGSPIGNFSCDY